MKDVEKVNPNGLFCNYIFKAIPLAFDESLSYYECLCGLLKYLKDTILPAINNNADALIEVQNLIEQLKKYVNTYFDSLDIQTEVNNKLDEMVEDGTLASIINEEIFNELNNQVETNTNNISLLPLKVTPNVRRLGRFLIPYGSDILSTDSAQTNFNLQGSCLTSSSTMIMMLVNNDDTSCTVKEFNFKNGQILRETVVSYAGHGNGIHKIGDYLYIATYTNLTGSTIKKVRYDDLSEVATYNFDFYVKTIYQDETTNKVYIANDGEIYEWTLDTTTVTKLFDWNIPNFEINVDGTIQTIAVYKDMIYLLGCCNQISSVVIFVLDKDGNLYTSYDLGTNNIASYYGEGQDIMQDGDVFYLTSVFRLGSTLYNDYQIDNVYTFNPFRQIHKDNYLSLRTPSTRRQINSSVNSFFCNGTTTYPYRFYFELALENQLTDQNLVGVISGGNQPLLYAKNERASYNVNGVTIEGVYVQNADLILTGSNSPVIDTPTRRNTHCEIDLEKGSRLSILNFIIGNSTSNANDYSILLGTGSMLQYEGLTMYHNIPIYNKGGIVQKSSNISNLETVNYSRTDPQIIYFQSAGASSYVSTLSVGDKGHKVMMADVRKYLQFNIRCGNNEFVYVSTGSTSLSSFTFTRIATINLNHNIYFGSIIMSYDPTNKNFVVTFDSIVDSSGNSVDKSNFGYCAASLLIIV